MQNKLKENKGITLVSLAITIVVLGIIASISIYAGRDTIKRANLESLRTNMLLIEAKAKEYVEEANFKIGKSSDANKIEEVRREVYENEAKLEKATGISAPPTIPVSQCYKVTEATMNEWGLKDIEVENGEYYLIKFDDANATVEIYNTEGYEGKYSLTEIDKIEE